MARTTGMVRGSRKNSFFKTINCKNNTPVLIKVSTVFCVFFPKSHAIYVILCLAVSTARYGSRGA